MIQYNKDTQVMSSTLWLSNKKKNNYLHKRKEMGFALCHGGPWRGTWATCVAF